MKQKGRKGKKSPRELIKISCKEMTPSPGCTVFLLLQNAAVEKELVQGTRPSGEGMTLLDPE